MICTNCNVDYNICATLLCCDDCAACWCDICFNSVRRPIDVCPTCGSKRVWLRKPPSSKELLDACKEYLEDMSEDRW